MKQQSGWDQERGGSGTNGTWLFLDQRNFAFDLPAPCVASADHFIQVVHLQGNVLEAHIRGALQGEAQYLLPEINGVL
ncbi:hypothetical protein GCM10008938_49280 [Deinococcus roseus]|uniref:Uncharacterized protein n=1 Tax=Deinococcus roseus TaxID=392414 RepID=A0ABQ2DHE6_9DEIO|nr:hypothetical protein GCM10008938_49280 [Deinococcus roseus]